MDAGVVVGLVGFSVLVLGVIITVVGWDRYHSERPRPGSNAAMQPTTEMFVDPVTGKRQRVWADPRTGEREYRDE